MGPGFESQRDHHQKPQRNLRLFLFRNFSLMFGLERDLFAKCLPTRYLTIMERILEFSATGIALFSYLNPIYSALRKVLWIFMDVGFRRDGLLGSIFCVPIVCKLPLFGKCVIFTPHRIRVF